MVVATIINECKDPYETTRIQWKVSGRCFFLWLICIWGTYHLVDHKGGKQNSFHGFNSQESCQNNEAGPQTMREFLKLQCHRKIFRISEHFFCTQTQLGSHTQRKFSLPPNSDLKVPQFGLACWAPSLRSRGPSP